MGKGTLTRWSAIAALVLAVGCSKTKTTSPGDLFQDVAPDFSLSDVNPTSPSHGEEVSPRAYLQKISAWYFGHAT